MTGTNAAGTRTPRAGQGAEPDVKLLLELGPLALFFLANSRPSLFHWLVGPILPRDLPRTKSAC